MQNSSKIFSRYVLVGASLGLLVACPGKEEETGGTTDPGTTQETTGSTTEEPTVTGSTTGTTDETTGGTTVDPSTGTTVDPSTNTTVDPTTETTVDPTTSGDDPACACVDPGEFGVNSFICGSGDCGLIEPDCVPIPGDTGTDTGDEGGIGQDCELQIDDAKVDCAIDLLIAGEGAVKWTYSSDQGYSENGAFLQMLPGREGLTRSYSREDLGLEESAAGVVPLRPVEYFEGCKQEPTAKAKFYCLRDWSDQEPTAQCDDASFGTDF